jgi:hypothetical protein
MFVLDSIAARKMDSVPTIMAPHFAGHSILQSSTMTEVPPIDAALR